MAPAPQAAAVASPEAADRLLRAAVRHSAGRVAALLACAAAAAAAAVALPAVLGRTLDLLLAGDPQAQRWLLLAAALIGAGAALDATTAWLGGTTGARSTAWVRRRCVGRLLATEPRHGAGFSAGDLGTRLTVNAADTGTAPVTCATGVASLLTPVGGLVGLFLIDVWTAAAFLLGVPLLILLLRAFARGTAATVGAYQEVQGRIAGRLVEALAGARTVAAAGTAARERARILAPLTELDAEGRQTWRLYGRAVARTGVLMPLLATVVLAVGGLRLADGHLTVGALLAASRYAVLAGGVGAVTGALSALVRSRTAARRTAALLDLPAVPHGTRALPPDGPGTLELCRVGVRRDGLLLLHDVDLVVPGGTTTAVVGRSGAGKSLLAAVAGRLTDPDEGVVLLDGVPLHTLEPGRLRREVGYAFERPALFGGTVEEALAFGAHRPPAAELRAAAGAADAHGFVTRLPHGYTTPLADAPMSGGEAQRLGLARCFAHAGRLLILDDATSSLDTVTERRVSRALTRQVRPGTRLVVAHRVSSAARADLVVWLDGGRVRAVAPHAELWRDPAYRAAFADAPEPGAHAEKGEER
ncbi:ABC transporter ATP-binding protein [Streptomyces sp. 549]|uniref:ABC transporter ATP-binding protein n=1 Tax=Streptomyces sp. 549 TaxID=3049076 RepID=UPI0024C2BA6C|nr:ABC transporter ATP-binding protein [Streptomyces sp. 549]MDK1474912.1 ABC transporter ATP-binding protein [Streptomyces sp. 549]